MSWFSKFFPKEQSSVDIATSSLFDEKTFYKQFVIDLDYAKEELIIETPFMTAKRLNMFIPYFERLLKKNVRVFIITREPLDNDPFMAEQAEICIQYFERVGIQVLILPGSHHRKLAMIDRKILWEGSLNILSQTRSREFMRRIASEELTQELFQFLRFETLDVFKNNSALL